MAKMFASETAYHAAEEAIQIHGGYGLTQEYTVGRYLLEAKGLMAVSAETGYVPKNSVEVTSKEDAKKIIKLIDALEENEDVQSVYANYDIPEEWLEELQS